MSWRPEGYPNPHDTDKDRELGKHWGRARDYEDGWDDCLEALKKQGFHVKEDEDGQYLADATDWLIKGPFGEMNGHLVFIPESEETEEAD